MQEVALLSEDFPGLSTASPDLPTKAPQWPIQRVTEKKKPGSSSGWDSPINPRHIPAVHHNSSVNGRDYRSYGGQNDGWDVTGGAGWGDAASAGGWGNSVEPRHGNSWQEDQTNGHGHSGHGGAAARDDYHTPQAQGAELL